MAKAKKNYDCSGFATKYNTLCSDGLTLKPGCFSHQSGKQVPLVWEHKHGTIDTVLGHALLEEREDGVYAYCSFNGTEPGQTAKELVTHGDITSFSIYAVKPTMTPNGNGRNVTNATITEVSLVLAGANPQAKIDSVIAHSEEVEGGFIMSLCDDQCNLIIAHSEEETEPQTDPQPQSDPNSGNEHTGGDTHVEPQPNADPQPDQQTDPAQADGAGDISHSDDNSKGKKTLQQVFDEMSDEKKLVFEAVYAYAALGQSLADNENQNDDSGEDKTASIEEVLDTYTDEEMKTLLYCIGASLDTKQEKKESKKDSSKIVKHNNETEVNYLFMKRNMFENNGVKSNDANRPFFTKSELNEIVHSATANGKSIQKVFEASITAKIADMNESEIEQAKAIAQSEDREFDETKVIKHSIEDADIQHGITNLEYLMPEYSHVRGGTPDRLDNDTAWVKAFFAGVTIFPKNKIKNTFIRTDLETAKAQGWVPANVTAEHKKVISVVEAAKRETDAQMVYIRFDFDQDDLDDMDFDFLAFTQQVMKDKWREEVAKAALVGDGRSGSSKDKIKEDKIRPIATDTDNDGLYTMVRTVGAANATDATCAKNILDESIKARPKYHGSGNITAFVKSSILCEMLLIKLFNGNSESNVRAYADEKALALAMRVNQVVELPDDVAGDNLCIQIDLKDYYMGSNPKSKPKLLDGIDLDYNQRKYVLEGKTSGANTKPKSAFVFKRAAAQAGNGNA